MLSAYKSARVFVTGHTGFKGGWLTLWLGELGASVTGYSLLPSTNPALYHVLSLREQCTSVEGDIRDYDSLKRALEAAKPDFIFHLAAQPLVRASYDRPIETVETNILGTAHLLEAARQLNLTCPVVIVTTDKCYESQEWDYSYREIDPLGGHDLYSMSKAGAELVASSYRRSFFARGGVRIATARAGNVIGGGDWGEDRLIPDVVRAAFAGRPVVLRNPDAVRPWQHVLEPLGGYLILGALLMQNGAHAEAWNFGPSCEDLWKVSGVVEAFLDQWGQGTFTTDRSPQPHETNTLRLNIDKAVSRLGWVPQWTCPEAIARTAQWYRSFYEGAGAEALKTLSLVQVREYQALLQPITAALEARFSSQVSCPPISVQINS